MGKTLDLSTKGGRLTGRQFQPEEPTENSLMAASPAAKYYWINKDLLTVEGDLVWRIDKDQPKRVVIPESFQSMVLEMCHDILAAGHQKVHRTTERMKEMYFWHGMSGTIKNSEDHVMFAVSTRNPLEKRDAH